MALIQRCKWSFHKSALARALARARARALARNDNNSCGKAECGASLKKKEKKTRRTFKKARGRLFY